MSAPARQFYQSGLPFVYRVLPLCFAGLAERLLILLIPLLVVVFPVVRFVPALYQYMVERVRWGPAVCQSLSFEGIPVP